MFQANLGEPIFACSLRAHASEFARLI